MASKHTGVRTINNSKMNDQEKARMQEFQFRTKMQINIKIIHFESFHPMWNTSIGKVSARLQSKKRKQ